MRAIDTIRMDKTAFSISRLNDSSDEIAYWQTKTPQERLEAVEMMRQILYGYDPASSGLQRFFEIAEYPPR